VTAGKTLGLCVSQPILWRATDHEDNHENGGPLGRGLTAAIRQLDPVPRKLPPVILNLIEDPGDGDQLRQTVKTIHAGDYRALRPLDALRAELKDDATTSTLLSLEKVRFRRANWILNQVEDDGCG
jgi:hypothetical protein